MVFASEGYEKTTPHFLSLTDISTSKRNAISMRKKIPALYVYNTQSHTFTSYLNLVYDNIRFSHEFDGVGDHTYACRLNQKIRIEINKKPEVIFHDRVKHEYRIWLEEPNHAKGLEILSTYILDRITTEICYHEQALGKLNDKLNKVNESFAAYQAEIKRFKHTSDDSTN
mgnify:FL=1